MYTASQYWKKMRTSSKKSGSPTLQTDSAASMLVPHNLPTEDTIRATIRINRKYLTENLQAGDICHIMSRDGTLTKNDVRRIEDCQNKQTKVEMLLFDILPKRKLYKRFMMAVEDLEGSEGAILRVLKYTTVDYKEILNTSQARGTYNFQCYWELGIIFSILLIIHFKDDATGATESQVTDVVPLHGAAGGNPGLEGALPRRQPVNILRLPVPQLLCKYTDPQLCPITITNRAKPCLISLSFNWFFFSSKWTPECEMQRC